MVKFFLKVIEKWTEKGKKELSPLSNVARANLNHHYCVAMELEKKVAKILPRNVLLQVINNTLQWSFVITITVALRDCAIIIRRGAEKLEGGHYIKLLPR